MNRVFWLEDIPPGIGNKFLAVNIAAKRARQLNGGAMANVKVAGRKVTTVALEEEFKGMLEYQVQPIEPSRLIPSEPAYDSSDDYDIPAGRLSDVDEVFEIEEEGFDAVPKDDEEEEPIFEVEYIDDSDYYCDDDEDYER